MMFSKHQNIIGSISRYFPSCRRRYSELPQIRIPFGDAQLGCIVMESWLTPLYDAEGMRAVDRWAIEERGVPSLELMEAAGRAVAEAVAELAPGGPVRVVCGKGNNAGDGLVAARHLREMGFEVEALLLWPGDELSGDAAANLRRVEAEHVSGELDARLADSGAVVDA